MNRTRIVSLWALRAAVAACGKPAKSSGPKGIGERKIEGGGQGLAVVPHTAAVLYLHTPTHPAGKLMPPDAFVGELHLVSADGTDHLLGREASNLTGNLAFSSDGKRLAFLDHFSFETHRGDLVEADVATGAVTPVASDVGYFGFRGDGLPGGLWSAEALGYIAGDRGELKVDGQLVDPGVATFEFVKGGAFLLYRQRSNVGGALKIHGRLDGQPVHRTLAEHVGDYQIAPEANVVAYTVVGKDGKSELHASRIGGGVDDRKLGTEVSSFQLSPEGKSVAYVAGIDPHRLLGDLYVADVTKPSAPEHLGKDAGTYKYSADGRLAFVTGYYEPTRAGKLALWDPVRGVQPVVDSARVFGFSPSGKYLGYLKRVLKPLYTEHLMLLPLGALGAPLGEPRLVGEAIYAFDFTPDEKGLLFKSDCTRGGEACELMAVPVDAPGALVIDGGVQKNPAARRLVSAVDDYDFSPDGLWLWITFKNPVGNTSDLAVIPAVEPSLPRYVDWKVEPGVHWTGTGKLAYVVNAPKRAGLYLADPAAARAIELHR